MRKPSLRIRLSFRKARIVARDKGAGVGFMGGLGRPDGIKKEGMGNLFGYEG